MIRDLVEAFYSGISVNDLSLIAAAPSADGLRTSTDTAAFSMASSVAPWFEVGLPSWSVGGAFKSSSFSPKNVNLRPFPWFTAACCSSSFSSASLNVSPFGTGCG